MKIPFWKMHGAGNDFILVDDRNCTFPIDDKDWLASVGTRRTGVGCDGFILIQPSDKASFRMRFINPDGTEVEMCGNGSRCIARLAYEIDAAPEKMTIETVAGILNAEAKGEQVLLGMTTPIDWNLNATLSLRNGETQFSSVNTGVPHVVVQIDNLEELDIVSAGSEIRYHDAFAPAGTNANFISISDTDTVKVRTYERGVENETLACGTGMVACALVAAKAGLVKAPVTMLPASGDQLVIDFVLTENGAEDVTMLGPAVHVFQGTLEYKK